jgi:hypothetical protein
MRCRSRGAAHAAKQPGGRGAEEQLPAAGGPVRISGGADWQTAMAGLASDDYHFVYVCRKRGGQAADRA